MFQSSFGNVNFDFKQVIKPATHHYYVISNYVASLFGII